MESGSVNLPEGYTLDEPNAPNVPEGYTLDQPPGPLESAARGALRNFPLAQQATAALEPGEYGKNLEGLVSKAEAGKAAHPWAYGAGAIAGTAAPLLIPGVGEGLEAAPILGNAAMNAVQSQSDTDMTRPTMGAMKQALLAAGIGGGLGALGGKFAGKAAPKVAEPAAAVAEEAAPAVEQSVAPTVEQAATRQVPKATLGHTPGGLVPDKTYVSPEFVPSADRIAASNFVRGWGFNPRQFKAFAKELGENPLTAGADAEKWAAEKGVVKLLDHPGEGLARVTEIKEDAGKTIGDTISKFGDEKIPVQELSEQIKGIAWHTIDPTVEAKLLKTVDRMEEISKKGWLDWNGLNKIKGMVGEHVHDDPAIAKAYGVLASKMSEMADIAGKKVGDPTLRAAYESAKRDYRMASLLAPSGTYAEAKNIVGGPAGHNTLRGVLGQLVEAFTGLPPAAQVVKNAMAKSAPLVRGVGEIGRSVGKTVSPISAPVGKAVGKSSLPQIAQTELFNYLQSLYEPRR